MTTQPPEHQSAISNILTQIEDTRGWPHSPSISLVEQAQQAYNAAYVDNNSQPVSVQDFELADTFQDVLNTVNFRTTALPALAVLRKSFPKMPFLSHLASLALMGATSHTVGLACASESTNPESQTVTRIASVSQVIRDLQWLGFDPIYPSFKGLTTFILVNPETGEPKAAVGISPEYMQNDHTTPLREDPPDNPETQALRITLGWHGANVYWLPHR